MSKYIFITPTLSDMGGAQMYIRNKVLFLKNQGWDVYVLSAKASNVVIPELRVFNDVYPEMGFYLFECTPKTQKKISERILKLVPKQNGETMIVESTGIVSATWGEWIAKLLEAKHLLFVLQEKNIVSNRGLQEFLVFKHQRHEIAGISKKTLIDIFSPFFKIKEEQSFRLSASCNNVEADVDHPILHQINKDHYDYVVGCLSRLDKPFVIPAITEFCSFTNRHINKKFLLLLLGDAPKNSLSVSQLREMVSQHDNVELIVTGYLYPVPIRLLEMCDIFMSSAGSSHVCQRSGVPTIVFDANDCFPIGVLGRNTKNTLFRDDHEPPLDLKELLYRVLINQEFKKIAPNYRSGIPNFNTHMDFLMQSEKIQKYYDVSLLKPETSIEKIFKLILAIFGAKTFDKIRSYRISNLIKRKVRGWYA